MKVTLNWLRQYVGFAGAPEELAERLTMLGMEVERMEKQGGELEGVVVAQVMTRDKHPNADKLSLCQVNDGRGVRQIVCGAQNFQAGDKVPLILPGASLPAQPGQPPHVIKVGKIRGVESQGMLCSPAELGLPDAVDGLLILRPDAVVGQPLAEYLGRAAGDVIYDLEITPNRPDWNSVIGIARDLSASTGQPLRLPAVDLPAPAPATGAPALAVRVEQPELCPRYIARVLRGIKVGPSPDWLRTALEKSGLRSINNVVDVTNFVMLETGQPLHAFDFNLIDKTGPNGVATIVVRAARAGEKFITLDGREHTLDESALMIADETKALALAGIMGGKNSEIRPETTDLLLESASFKPQGIRATSKKLDVRTDSSYRFERGGDAEICNWASRRAAQLILATAGGELVEPVLDVFPAPAPLREIRLRHHKTNELLGINIPEAEQNTFLQRLGLQPVSDGVFQVPSFRVDLKREVDLIEEIGRLHGIDKIPATPPRGARGQHVFDSTCDELALVRRLCVGLGFTEIQEQTLIADASVGGTAPEEVARLQRPLSSDMNVLRPSLMPGLLQAVRHNVARQNPDLALFELGRVFLARAGGFREERRLSFVLTGRRFPIFWSGAERDAAVDVFDLKGAVEEFLEQIGLRGAAWGRREGRESFFLEGGALQLGKLVLGEIGQITPALQKKYDVRQPVFLAEFNLDQILARRSGAATFKALPSFPAIRRDVAMLVPENTSHEAVANLVKQSRPTYLEKFELFDVFRGGTVPKGEKSVAYAFIYRNAERTLTDTEVNSAHEKLVQQFQQQLQATVRTT